MSGKPILLGSRPPKIPASVVGVPAASNLGGFIGEDERVQRDGPPREKEMKSKGDVFLTSQLGVVPRRPDVSREPYPKDSAIEQRKSYRGDSVSVISNLASKISRDRPINARDE